MAGHGTTHKYKPGEVAWGAEHHILPISVYAKTILALFFLMVLTIWAATWPINDLTLGPLFVHATVFRNLIALTIAIIKASLTPIATAISSGCPMASALTNWRAR